MKAVVAIKSKGVVVNAMEVINQVKMWLGDASNGNYTLSFERVKRPRSNEQNRLMWVWFTCIARSWSEASGCLFTAQNVHDAYCIKFLPITLPNGVTVTGGTSKLTSEQMTEFLNKVQADAATEYGITLLSITDPMYDLWSKQYINN